jgi:hypothetical protein
LGEPPGVQSAGEPLGEPPGVQSAGERLRAVVAASLAANGRRAAAVVARPVGCAFRIVVVGGESHDHRL